MLLANSFITPLSSSPYAILGISPSATSADVEAAYKGLADSLSQEHIASNARAAGQARRALERVSEAYNQIRDPDFRKRFEDENIDGHTSSQARDCRPRLGQMCVASGLITMEQLKEAVDEQVMTGLPLGEVLQDKQFISPIQLEGLLLGQEMIDVSSKCDDPIGERLIALDIVSEDMVLITQMEQKSLGQPLVNLLLRRGWVEESILKALGITVTV